ncbi:phosphotransferase [Rhizobium leguminosarum bv. viciae]|uniref:phosphotransferase n=1 Tax=Rhizobium leguminosarum TaxID=384 RepID=UPI001442055B|nr:phosphotransferase [Rhizobium leguminosarum]NKK01193.1 phosphotransferase [Rhizobium leguminosarum bv. viciae]
MNLASNLLDEPGLAKVLIEKKLITRRAFVAGDVRLTLADRRNRNAKITIAGADGLFAKQAKTQEALGTIRKEAEMLKFLAGVHDDLSDYLPRQICFDEELCLLVTGLIPDGRSLQYILTQGDLGLGHAAAAGVILANLHKRSMRHDDRSAKLPPPILALNNPHASLLGNLSPANMQLIEAIQSDHELSAGMDRLRADWRLTSMIHGDAKWDNMVVAPGAFVLVDWELATIGDPRWDVGTVFSSFFSAWIASTPMAFGAGGDLMMRESQLSIDKLRPTARMFWLSYKGVSELGSLNFFRDEAMAYCAGRLIQTAFEYMQDAARLTANAIYMIQMAANILRDPRRVAELLLGTR